MRDKGKKEKTVKKHEIDMVNGPILKKMLVFSLPLMLSSIMQMLFNATDIVVLGSLSAIIRWRRSARPLR